MRANLPAGGEDRAYLPDAYRLSEGEARGAVAPHLPRVVFLEATNRCNLVCETCPRTFVTYEPAQTLAWENFIRIVEQFPAMQRAVLHGIGEPLLNKDLPRMIEHLKTRGVTVLFNTNATLLDDAWAARLSPAGWTSCAVRSMARTRRRMRASAARHCCPRSRTTSRHSRRCSAN